MDEGPYKKQKMISQREVCNYCKYCRSHVVYKRKSHDILSAECNHPKVEEYCPSLGGYSSNHLDHDGTDIFSPNWCPVKKEKL